MEKHFQKQLLYFTVYLIAMYFNCLASISTISPLLLTISFVYGLLLANLNHKSITFSYFIIYITLLENYLNCSFITLSYLFNPLNHYF